MHHIQPTSLFHSLPPPSTFSSLFAHSPHPYIPSSTPPPPITTPSPPIPSPFLPSSTMSHIFSFLLLLFSSLSAAASAQTSFVGVNYGRIADDLPPPSQVVELLKSQQITHVKIFDTDPDVLLALANSNLSVVVTLPNEQLVSAASDQTFTDSWVSQNILSYLPSTNITSVAIGNEVFVDPANISIFLVPAMEKVQASLVKFNISGIKVSSPMALSALSVSYPPSAGSFKEELSESVIRPMLEFLRSTDSYVMANVYPFFAYAANSGDIPIEYALGEGSAIAVVDEKSGLSYSSLFEAQLDAVFTAMGGMGYSDIKVVVTETGWPSVGDENEIGAGKENAAAYNGNLVKKVAAMGGTPVRPQEDVSVFLFALFNENLKPGPTSERNYGMFFPDKSRVYQLQI